MSGNIKGITIEFAGDTRKLDSALRDINKNTRNLDRELKAVDKALKFNPTSVELWRQKQDLLSQKIGETKQKLDVLKQAQAKIDADGVDKNSAEYKKLQREIIETESKVKTFEGQLRKIGQVNLRATSEKFKEIGTSLESAGQKMKGVSIAAAGVVAGLGAISYKAGTAADDLNTLSKVTGISTGDLQKYSYAADLVDVSTETLAKANVKLKKSMFSARDGGATAEVFEELGVAVTDANGNLRDSEAVFQDVLKSLGSMENETERDALAMQILGKSASELNPLIEDGGETYKMVADTLKKYNLDYIDQETLDKANQFNDQLDTMKLLGSVAFAQVGSQLAAAFAPALEKVVDLVGKFASWLGNLDPKLLTIIGAIAGVVAVVAPLLIGLGKVSFAISSIMSLAATIGPMLGGIIAAIGPVILIIGALVVAGVLLYKNWDTIKLKASQLVKWVTTQFTNLKTRVVGIFNSIKTTALSIWNGIKTGIATIIGNTRTAIVERLQSIKEKASSIFEGVKTAITSPVEKAKEIISGIIDKIKGFFNFSVPTPRIPLPHFSISPSGWKVGDLLKGSIPRLSVNWYKTGGIFDSPSVIGVGEAGAEAVVPLDKFWNKLDNLTDNALGGGDIIININGATSNPQEIAEEVRRVLIQETKRRRLAWQ